MNTLRTLLFSTALTVAVSLSAAETGFALGSVSLGYMSQDEFAERVSVEEVSGYINRLKAKCVDLYVRDEKVRQFYVVVVVHSGHSHVWIADVNGATVVGEEEKAKKLQEVTLPALKKSSIAFALDARVAGGKPDQEGGFVVVPMEWKEAISKSKPPGPLRFDDVIRLVCDK